MWTTENRTWYAPSKLHYVNDMTDDGWAITSNLIPPAKRGGGERQEEERQVVTGLTFILSTGCPWAYTPNDLLPHSAVNDYFRRWDYDALSIVSFARCISEVVDELSTRLARLRPSSTAKASRVQKKGRPYRPAGLRCEQKDQQQEAPCPGRHTGPATVRHRPCYRYPGSRRRRDADGRAVRSVSVSAKPLRGRWISVSEILGGPEPCLLPDQCGERKTLRYQLVRGAAQAGDCGANNRLALPVPPSGQGRGVSQPERFCVPTLGLRLPDGQKALSDNHVISDGLLGLLAGRWLGLLVP